MRPKVLFLTQEYPFPANRGGKLRDAGILMILSEFCDVEILYSENESKTLEIAGIKKTKIPKHDRPLFEKIISPFRPYLLNGVKPETLQILHRKSSEYRILWLSRLTQGKYLEAATQMGYKVILDEHNV